MPRRSYFVPAWIYRLAGLAKLIQKHGSLKNALFAVISSYVVATVFGFGSYIVGSILAVFDWITLSIAWVQVQLGGAFAFVGFDILWTFGWLQGQLATAAASAGPLAPVITIAIGAVVFAVTYRALIALLGELPVGSSIVDFLGLR